MYQSWWMYHGYIGGYPYSVEIHAKVFRHKLHWGGGEMASEHAVNKLQIMGQMGQNVKNRLIWVKSLWLFFVLCWQVWKFDIISR